MTACLLLFVDNDVVGLDALSVRSLSGLRSCLSVAGENGANRADDLATLLVGDLERVVVDLFQRGSIPGRIALDRIVLSVELPAPLAVRGLAFRVDAIVRKLQSAFNRVDLAEVGPLRRRTRNVLRLGQVYFPVPAEHVCCKRPARAETENGGS